MRVLFLRSAVIAVLLLAMAAVPLAVAEVTQLDWTDSGKELKPGEYLNVYVHAEGNGVVGLADAAFRLRDIAGRQWVFGIGQQGRDVYIVMEGLGNVKKIGHLGITDVGRKTFDTAFFVKVYCPGEAPDGQRPQQGKLWVVVRNPDSGRVGYYLAEDPGRGQVALDIDWFGESTVGISSHVTFGEVQKYSDCGSGYSGDEPSNGQTGGGTSNDKANEQLLDPETMKYLLFGGLAVAGLAVLASVIANMKR